MAHRPPEHCEDTEEVYPCVFNTSGTALCADLLVFSSTMEPVAIDSNCDARAANVWKIWGQLEFATPMARVR